MCLLCAVHFVTARYELLRPLVRQDFMACTLHACCMVCSMVHAHSTLPLPSVWLSMKHRYWDNSMRAW